MGNTIHHRKRYHVGFLEGGQWHLSTYFHLRCNAIREARRRERLGVYTYRVRDTRD